MSVMPSDDVLAQQLLVHLNQNTTDHAAEVLRLPVSVYYDPERAADERAVFRNVPVPVAHTSELATAGAYKTLDLLGVPLLIVRQDDGSVRAFRNICTHRGGRVEMAPEGSSRLFTCKYHGWSFERDGSLRHIPYEEGFAGVDKACSGLMTVAAADHRGIIWVQLDDRGPSLDVAAFLGEQVDAQLGELGLDSLKLYLDERFRQPTNWKLIAEGNLDVLHPKFLHPDTVGKLIQTRTHTWETYGRHSRHAMARRKLDEIRDSVTADSDLRRYVITSYFVFPATWFNIQPTHIEWWTLVPGATSPTDTHIAIRYLIPQHPTEREQLQIDKSWEIARTIIPTEDWQMARMIQEGAPHATVDTFIYGSEETPVQHLHLQLMAAINELRAAP